MPTNNDQPDIASVILWIVVVALFITFLGMFVKRLAMASADSWSATEVYDLGSDEFENLVKSGKSVANLFYAPWCPHCRSLKPLYQEASKQFPNTIFSMVDCDKHPGCAQKNSVRAFPACNVYKRGQRSNGFVGGRPSLEALVAELIKAGAN
jgi:thioredoxin-like negative regulator of GroEL